MSLAVIDLLQLQRSTVQYQARPDHDADLLTTMLELAQQRRHYGYRRLWRLVRRRGQLVNKKRIQRRWQRLNCRSDDRA